LTGCGGESSRRECQVASAQRVVPCQPRRGGRATRPDDCHTVERKQTEPDAPATAPELGVSLQVPDDTECLYWVGALVVKIITETKKNNTQLAFRKIEKEK